MISNSVVLYIFKWLLVLSLISLLDFVVVLWWCVIRLFFLLCLIAVIGLGLVCGVLVCL